MNSKSIRIIGTSNILKKLVQNRISERMIHSINDKDTQSNLTICFQRGDVLETKISNPCIIIRPWNRKITPFGIENCIELHLRDMLCIDQKGVWGPPDIFEWVTALNSNVINELEKYPIRYWTSIKDVVSLIETLIELPELPTLVTTVCGRRPWIANDVFSELRMLWRRVNNAKNNQIDCTDLEVKSLPLTNIKSNTEVPDLSKLHNLIKPINEIGWTPNTPLRISLMECLEEIIDF